MKRSILALPLFTALPAFAAEAAHAVKWYKDPVTHTAFAALVVFLIIAARMGAFKAIFSSLDNRAEDIQNQINEARALREEAAKLMADAERKAKEADAAAQDIVKRAKADAKTLMAQAKDELEAKVARREAQAEQRIARAESEAADDVRRAAADAATKAATDILAGADKGDDQFDKALKEISTRLN